MRGHPSLSLVRMVCFPMSPSQLLVPEKETGVQTLLHTCVVISLLVLLLLQISLLVLLLLQISLRLPLSLIQKKVLINRFHLKFIYGVLKCGLHPLMKIHNINDSSILECQNEELSSLCLFAILQSMHVRKVQQNCHFQYDHTYY